VPPPPVLKNLLGIGGKVECFLQLPAWRMSSREAVPLEAKVEAYTLISWALVSDSSRVFFLV